MQIHTNPLITNTMSDTYSNLHQILKANTIWNINANRYQLVWSKCNEKHTYTNSYKVQTCLPFWNWNGTIDLKSSIFYFPPLPCLRIIVIDRRCFLIRTYCFPHPSGVNAGMSIRLDRNTDMKEGDTRHKSTYLKLEPEQVKSKISLSTEHAVFRR